MLAAVLLWTAGLVVTFASPGYRSLTGRLKGGDFIQLYALATVALERDYPRLEDAHILHERQVQLVPASDLEFYLPVYPPQAALLFAPLALLPYATALSLWTLVLVAGYASIVWYTWRSVRDVLPDGRFVAAAAAAFPPFFNLVLFGQTTLVPLAGFFLGYAALRAGRPFAAGAALGILSIKPQFGLVLAGVVLSTGQWRMLLGAVSSIALQISAVLAVLGVQALTAYYETLSGIPAVESLLEPNSWRMHSLRSITKLVAEPGGSALWLLLSAGTVAIVVRVWRTDAPLEARFGILTLATVLINPHLFVYDATVLALSLLWLGGWMEREQLSARREYWSAVYALYVLFLLPTAALIYVQGSVVLLAWMFWRVSRVAYTLHHPYHEAIHRDSP